MILLAVGKDRNQLAPCVLCWNLYLIVLLIFISSQHVFGELVNGQISTAFSALSEVCSGLLSNQTIACKAAHIKIETFSTERLAQNLIELDDLPYVHRIHIDHKYEPRESELVGRALDDFLAPRPWWLFVTQGKHHAHGVVWIHIILLRHSYWEKELRFIGGMQFLPSDVCHQVPLLMGHMVDAGWGSQSLLYGYVAAHDIYKVFNIWDSSFNYPNESTYYVNRNQCPELVNKRLCVFLPMTNCSVPLAITQADHTPSKVNKNRIWDSDLQYYSSASNDGRKLDSSKEIELNSASIPYHKSLVDQYNINAGGNWPAVVPSSRAFGANGKQSIPTENNKFGMPSSRMFLFAQAFLFRPNWQFRALLFDAVSAYRQEYKFPVSTSSNCVAIHIRRGDRVINNKDDVEQEQEVSRGEYCHRYRVRGGKCYRPTSDGKATEVLTVQQCRDRLADLGCFSSVAFGALSLVDYLKAAATLSPTSRTAVVLTDDKAWLEQQRKNLTASGTFADWHIQAVPARFGRYERERETDNGIDYLMSIAFAKQCHAFVGHFWSGFSKMIYQSMCFNHGLTSGHCPDVYDVGRIYNAAGDDEESCYICEK